MCCEQPCPESHPCPECTLAMRVFWDVELTVPQGVHSLARLVVSLQTYTCIQLQHAHALIHGVSNCLMRPRARAAWMLVKEVSAFLYLHLVLFHAE